jgi:hypothetical protein
MPIERDRDPVPPPFIAGGRNQDFEMTFDPTTQTPRSRGLRPRWLIGLFSTERPTRVSDLPTRVLDDIGISRDLVDAMLRHRR